MFRRRVRRGAADPAKTVKPSAPGYGDGFWYSRDHEPAGGIGELLGSYVMSGRIRGAISVVVGPDGREQVDVAGWADEKRKRKLTAADAVLHRPATDSGRGFLYVNCAPEFAEAGEQLRRAWESARDPRGRTH